MSRMTIRDEEFEQEFIKTTILIQQQMDTLEQHSSIRVNKWIEKLAKIVNFSKKTNRNLYIKLLYSQLLQKNLGEPFTRFPPASELPILNEYHIHKKIGKQVEKALNSKEADLYID